MSRIVMWQWHCSFHLSYGNNQTWTQTDKQGQTHVIKGAASVLCGFGELSAFSCNCIHFVLFEVCKRHSTTY